MELLQPIIILQRRRIIILLQVLCVITKSFAFDVLPIHPRTSINNNNIQKQIRIIHPLHYQGIHRCNNPQQKQRIIRNDGNTKNNNSNNLVVLYGRGSSKWDNIVDDEEDEIDLTGASTAHIARDMKYNKRNCERSNKNFIAIQSAGGLVYDVYCRRISDTELAATVSSDSDSTTTPTFNTDVFWYIGKVCHVSDITIDACMKRQYDLLIYHAGYLRPIELYTGVTTNRLELWIAPGNTELQVAYNDPTIRFIPMYPPSDEERDILTKMIKNSFLGFQGEVYTPNEDGFRTIRKYDGTPAKPEIQPPQFTNDNNTSENDDNENDDDDDDDSEFRMPSDVEMERIQKALEGKDINEIYEEQQRRLGKTVDE